MTIAATRIDRIIEAFRSTADDVVKSALSMPSGCLQLGGAVQFPPDSLGAYIGLIGPDMQMQIGLSSSHEGSKELSAALLCMEKDDPELDDDCIADAMGEIMNIIAGILKQNLEKEIPGLMLGLPLFINGHIRPNDKQQLSILEVMFGSVRAQLVLLVENVKG